jgi:PKD repeat protein
MYKYLLLLLVVIVNSNCQKHPIKACFTYSPAIVKPNTEVIFDASCTENPYKYVWRFNDGTNDTSIIGLATITHKFNIAGTFQVELLVIKKDGQPYGKDEIFYRQSVVVN